MRVGAAAAALVVAALTGCRSSYPGPSFAGEWVACPAGVTTLTLTLGQDLGAWLDAPVRGELVDAGGATWTIKGEPELAGDQGLLRGRPLRVGLGAPLRLVSDDGERREFDSGPLPWLLVRGRLPTGEEAVTLHVGQGGPLWAEAEASSWTHCTFVRAGRPPEPPAGDAAACSRCGRALEAGWRHCPECGARIE